MKVLLVKMSSMGDVIHCLPAVTDLLNHLPDIELDWVVEENFANIVNLHKRVSSIPVAIRRWRRNWYANRAEVGQFRSRLRQTHYDVVIDAQGLFKSAVVAAMARGPVIGFDRNSARESFAALTYSKAYSVEKGQHAIDRQRRLFASHFRYQIPDLVNYGIDAEDVPSVGDPYLMFLHGTTWGTKHWPENCWIELARLCAEAGYRVKLPWSSPEEKKRADRIAAEVELASVLPRLNLTEISTELAKATGAVTVDTGLGHLAAGLDVPLVGVYGPTSPVLTGVKGPRQVSLSDSDLECAPCLNQRCQYTQTEHSSKIYPPCFDKLNAERVFQELLAQIQKSDQRI